MAQAATHIPVTVSLATIKKTILVYDALLANSPVAEYHDVRDVTIALTDHPILLVLLPDPTRSKAH